MWGILKRDLGEFVTTLQDDVAVITSAITQGGGDDDGYESYSSEEGSMTRPPTSAAFRAVRADVKTYSEEVTESEADGYATFMKTFDVGSKTDEISTLLKEDAVVAAIHTRLVPEHVSYDDFWSRYFFRTEMVAKGRPLGMSFPNDGE
ncbi:unnamed protein product, partial [Sphacelaria rigidula]